MFDQSTLLRREAGEKLIGRRCWCSGSGQWRQGQLEKEEEKDVLRDSSGLARCATANEGPDLYLDLHVDLHLVDVHDAGPSSRL